MMGSVAGGMGRRDGPTLVDLVLPPGPVAAGDDHERVRPVVRRHCWVDGLPQAPGRWPGLLVEWRQASEDDSRLSGWSGRVVYAVEHTPGYTVLIEAWVAAEHLQPA